MSVSRVIEVSFGGGSIAYAKVDTAYFYNNGILFKPTDLDLPASYQVHWADSPQASSTLETIGTAEGAPIPDDLWNRSRVIYGWIYLHPTEDSGVTGYEVRIYKNVRAGLPDGTEPTPEEQSTIDQLISALNSAVEQTGQDAESASQSARSASDDADRAESARDTAQTYANNAQTSANNASASASQASTSASASAQSASASAQIKSDIEGMVDDAQGYAQASAQSATASANSATTAQGYANTASVSAQSASTSASNASTSAQAASTKASEASTSASTASQKATEASQSASQALSYKTDAESAKTASQTAQGKAEDAQTAAETAQGLAESARDDAIQAKNDAESAVASISGALAEKAPVITDTASGSIASFSDGADDLPLKSLVIDINPVQDLHGQDAPYPAGGGKNKITATEYGGNLYGESAGKDLKNLVDVQDYTENGNVITVNVETAWRGRLFATSVLPAGDYHVHFETTEAGSRATIYVTDADLVVERYIANKLGAGTTSTNVTLTDSQRIAVIFANYQVGTVTVTNLQVESGSSYTAWSPYENICPISGWTSVDVEQSGVNVWDEEWEVGGLNGSNGANWNTNTRIRSKNYIPIKPNTAYFNSYPSYGVGIDCCFYDINKTFISSGSFASVTFTSPQNAYFMRFATYGQYGATYNHDISINYPSTDHSYHPYTGRSITISLGQTVYGGKLDVLSGELVIDRAMIDLGTLDWISEESYSIGQFRVGQMKILSLNPNYSLVQCSTLKGVMPKGYTQFNNGEIGLSNSPTAPMLRAKAETFIGKTAEEIKAIMQGQQLVYKLAEPVEIQLTPNQVNSLLGVNNIWADSGDVEVEYRADTKLFIERLTAPDSADMIADANITSGKYFMVGNSLYKATANIANGSAIVVGTNCIRKSLSEALNEINA